MGKIKNFFKRTFYSKFEKENHFKFFKNVILFFPIFKLFFRIRQSSLLKILEVIKILALFKMSMYKSREFYKKKTQNQRVTMNSLFFFEISQEISSNLQEISSYSSPIFLDRSVIIGLNPINSFPNKAHIIDGSKLEIGRKKIKTKTLKKEEIPTFRNDKKKPFSRIFNKKKLKETFFFGTSEFSQLKGWFNSTGKRIKTFSVIWNQSLWIGNEFYNPKKKKKSKKSKKKFFY